ncbi:MAG TPA: hypothetical protein VL328_02940 [Gemmatimonadaceae bacterium]|nr:hypothetical protein [Gemmatimonadaceae bacterium]
MSSMEGLDIRAPIGGLFSVLGLMLTVYGLVAGSPTTSTIAPATNVNLWWGATMLVFGIILLVMSRRVVRHPKNAPRPD